MRRSLIILQDFVLVGCGTFSLKKKEAKMK